MKKSKTAFRILSAMFTLVLALFLLTFSVYATGEGGDEPASDPEPVVTEAPVSETEAPEPVTEAPSPETEAPAPEEETEEAAAVTYTEPEHLNELPTASFEEIMLATEIPLPDVEVSDTTLLGGVIAWLCVAVGIALIAGVLVSKRTRRKNS